MPNLAKLIGWVFFPWTVFLINCWGLFLIFYFKDQAHIALTINSLFSRYLINLPIHLPMKCFKASKTDLNREVNHCIRCSNSSPMLSGWGPAWVQWHFLPVTSIVTAPQSHPRVRHSISRLHYHCLCPPLPVLHPSFWGTYNSSPPSQMGIMQGNI